MRRIAFLCATWLAAAACGGTQPQDPSPSPASTPASTVVPTTASPPSSPTPSPAPELPAGVPASFDRDVPAGDVPTEALVPADAFVDGTWYATTTVGEAIVVAYSEPSEDPFRAGRGLVIWLRFPASPPWRATFGLHHAAQEGVMSIRALVADVTGDGSQDALVDEITGGSGGCGTWRVLDLAANAQVWGRKLCDAQVAPASDPVGLALTQAIFRSGDAHCCPSASRTTTLVYGGDGRWAVDSRVTTPTG